MQHELQLRPVDTEGAESLSHCRKQLAETSVRSRSMKLEE